MDRREFIKTTGAAVAAVTATKTATAEANAATELAAPATIKGRRELRLVSPWGNGVAGLADEVFQLARALTDASDGRLSVRRVDSDAVSNKGSIATLKSGQADLYVGIEHDNARHHPAFSYFAGLPHTLGLDANDLDAWLHIGGGQDLWDSLSAQFGVKSLLVGHLGTNPAIWSSATLSDRTNFSGLKIAAQGLGASVATALGGTVVDVPSSELADALAQGKIVAAEWGNNYHNMTLGLHQTTSNITAPGLHVSGTAVAFSVGHELWQKLTPTERALIEGCAQTGFRNSRAIAAHQEAVLSKTLQEVHKMRTSTAHAELNAAISRVTDAVVAHTAATDSTSQLINASYMAFRREILGRHAGLVPSI